MVSHFPAFLALSILLIITPGADMALILKNALRHGRDAAWFTALGIATGLLVWTLAAAAGVAALLQASATAYTVLRLAGAAYLVYLGAQSIRASFAARAPAANEGDGRAAPLAAWPAYRQGLLSNLLNPKIAVFFTSFLPQFAGAHTAAPVATLVLGTLFTAMGLVWLSCYALAAGSAGRLLRRPRIRAALDRLTGGVLIAFGLRLATERR
jgi:threonine/homoserine/homoserine lactone efflux protein